ncbi:MAG: TIGR03617 family F420-dependent LLM class oxidoreductase [Myxococcales bacterium]|nr:TIGR03617 family F420-dependent LLM class oxidoreductase [Myxococcales bacterium]
MQVTATMGADVPLAEIPAYAKRVEALGYDALSVPEARHEGVLTALLALEHTTRLRVGTGVLVAFARSPMLAAQAAWDLQSLSNGRFELGLGTQVKGNVVGRFGMPWSAPAARLRDYIGAVRACFDTFQNGAPLDFRSESYTLNRMQPFFNPGPIAHPDVPILMGAIGPIMTRVVGEVADAVQTHPTNSEPRYLREVMRPRIDEGRRRAGRTAHVEIAAGPLVATGPDAAAVEAELRKARETLVFTLSTPAYWPALEHHGWRGVGERLLQCTREGRWQEMDAALPDEVVRAFVPAATYDEIADVLAGLYDGVADRILFPVPDDPANDDAARRAIAALRAR